MQRTLGETRATRQPETNGLTNGHVNGVNGINGVNGVNGVSHKQNAEAETFELDALVVGAGFAGCYLLHQLRKEGFSVKIVEAGTGLGGIWHWNSYPGARVDSQYPIYQYSLPDIYTGWRWSEEYPGSAELRAYFQHVDEQWNLSKDVIYGNKVIGATFDEKQDKWIIECDTGTRITTRFFLCCTGFAAKRHFPDWPGLDSFEGTICHSSFWPEGGMDVRGKKVAVVGTGATGIQIAQTTARDAAELTVFQRTPNLCCPMRQAKLSSEQAEKDIVTMAETMKMRYGTFAGFLYEPQKNLKTFDHSTEEREAFLEGLWQLGGFRLLANNYSDMLSDHKSNREVYDFWAKKTRARIVPEKRDVLAPLDPPHPFGGKRLSLEQDFYEQMNKPNVNIINIRANPITHVVPSGIVTSDNKVHEFDIIAIATGFDSLTGGLKDMNLIGLNSEKLVDKWRHGTYTAYGITVANFPNFFFLYGPQAPTAYANGPSITEPQGEWVVDVLKRLRGMGKTRINATVEAEMAWKKQVNELHRYTLRNEVDSWYMGTNIPGKPKEPLNYAGGIPEYMRQLNAAVKNDFEGFTVQ